MESKRPTLKDIADRLQLSLPTVSRALAGHPDISEATRERVREVAQALHYVPNYRARYLRAKHSRLIALIVPELNMFFVPSLITGINRVLQQHDYSLVVFQSDNSLVQERRLVEYCASLGPDGVLLALSSETMDLAHLDALRGLDIPVALFDKTIDTSRFSTITLDDLEAGQVAAEYLLDHGHRRMIGVFGDPRQRISALRMRGFKRAHSERMLPIDDKQIVRVSALPDFETEFEHALDANPDVTAVFTMSDELLVRAHHVLMRRGARIPAEMSLLAISEGNAPEFLYPKVTHLLHSGAQVGERMAHIMIGLITHRSASMIDVRIHTTLVDLGSVACIGTPVNHP